MNKLEHIFSLLKAYYARMPSLNWRLVASAVVAVGILHICATLAAPHMISTTAYSRLKPLLPVNELLILPEMTPESQPIPFMTPDVRYAMCRYDTGGGGVKIRAVLPGRGWSLALHAPEGDNIYTALGREDRATVINLHLVPTGSRFSGLTPESMGVAGSQRQIQVIAARKGIAIIRAPDRGASYARDTQINLLKTTCVPDENPDNS